MLWSLKIGLVSQYSWKGYAFYGLNVFGGVGGCRFTYSLNKFC